MARFKLRAMFSLLAASTVALSAMSACSKDPYDPKTWIDKLDDSSELEVAMTKLKELRCPEAITPVGKVWEKHNKWRQAFSLILYLADQPHMVEGYENYPDVDCPDAGPGPYWDDAVPFLISAVQDFDVTAIHEIEDAAKAAEALGKAKSPEAIQVLISAATKEQALPQGQLVRIAAVKALGGYGDNKDTVETIIKVLEIKASKKTIYMNKAAADALVAARSPISVVPLLKAVYNIPPIYHQLRTALTNIGKPAATEILKAFDGKQTVINKVAVDGKFATDCETAQGLDTNCIAPGNIRYKAAQLLGDMRAKEAIPSLVAAIKEPGKVSFYAPNTNAPGPLDTVAVLDALRTMGAYSAAGDVNALMKAEGTDRLLRPLAVDVFSMLTKDSSELPWLKETMLKPAEENDLLMPLRQAATLAYARLATSAADLAPLDAKIAASLATAATKTAAAAKETNAIKKAELDGSAKFHRGQAVQVEQHRARAQVGIMCGKKLDCYQGFLNMDAKAVVAKLKIPNHADATKPMKRQAMDTYRIAALERALLEITKMGKAAKPAFADLLKHVESSERIVRQGVLLALIEVAPTPCNECATRLDQVITAQKGQSTLGNLNSDTKIILNYFVNQGAKVAPAVIKPPAEPEAE